MQTRMSRAVLVLAKLVLMAGVALTGISEAGAEHWRAVFPTTALTALGLPELRITVNENGVDAPTEIAAGRVLMTVEADGRGDVDVHLVQLPPGVTEAEAEAVLAASGDADVPAVVHEWDFAGGLFVPRGATDHLVLDLAPGDWFIVGADSGASLPSALIHPLTVTAGEEAPVVEIVADVRVELREFAFGGLPDEATTGRQIWQVANRGEQPHHIVLAHYPGEITLDQVRTLMALGEEEVPPPGFPVDPERIEFDVAQVHVLSPGRTVWVELDLTRPGSYIALCFMPDREMDNDHASLGMVDVVALTRTVSHWSLPAFCMCEASIETLLCVGTSHGRCPGSDGGSTRPAKGPL